VTGAACFRWSCKLTEIEAISRRHVSTSLDLDFVAVNERAALWRHSARTFFPGLSVRELHGTPRGSIRGMRFGPGQLWWILSPPTAVHYEPAIHSVNNGETFSVMLQIEGITRAAQGQRSCQLCPHDICVIDGREPFELEVGERFSQFIVVQMPRPAALTRHPYLAHHTAQTFDASEPGVGILGAMLTSLMESAPLLEDDQQSAALTAIAQLLGVPKAPHASARDDVNWRVRAALAFIDGQLGDPQLTASRVAEHQRISRRRLDDIMLQTIGTSITAQIWLRRITQAAEDLLNPRYATHTVTQIAFALGFEDAAHFARAFKRRYQCTPREWRNRQKVEGATTFGIGNRNS
jgi:AraC family transcriptional regulator, positive regulator of tynA and feaB